MKNRKLLLIVSLVLALTMSLGGTLAYLQDTDEAVNVMMLGNVKVEQFEMERVFDENGNVTGMKEYTQDKPLYPVYHPNASTVIWAPEGNDKIFYYGTYIPDAPGGNGLWTPEMVGELDKFVFVKNTGTGDLYYRMIFAVEADTTGTKNELGQELIHLNVNGHDLFKWAPDKDGDEYLFTIDIAGTTYGVLVATYQAALKPGEISRPSLLQVAMDYEADNDYVEQFGDEFEILAITQAVQTVNMPDVDTALTTAFGEVTAENALKWFCNVKNVAVASTADELAAAVADGKTSIMLADGEYDIKNCGGKTLTISGSKNAIITPMNEGESGCDYGFDGSTVTFNGVTIDATANTGSYKGFGRMKGTYNDCDFIGSYTTNDDSVFNNCSFDFKNDYLWTWGANNVTFNDCTFAGDNTKAILAHGSVSTKITVNNCKFEATVVGTTYAGDPVAVVEIDPTSSNTYTINFTGTNTKTDSYVGWTRVKDDSTGHTITGVN